MRKGSKIKMLVIEKIHEIFFQQFSEDIFEITFSPQISVNELVCILPDYEVLVLRSGFHINKEIILAASRLKLIGRLGSGMENIDVVECTKRQIACINSPEGNSNAVGEHTLGLLLGLCKRISRSDREIRNGIWSRQTNQGIELSGKKIGIIGYGNTGQSFAKKLVGFDCSVLAYDKYKRGFGCEEVIECGMEELYNEVDILSLHIPYNNETHYLVSEPFIRQFSKPFYLLNTSRGSIINTESLLRGLKEGKILGAGLDVLEFETSNFQSIRTIAGQEAILQELLLTENVTITPHIAGVTAESAIKLAEILAKKIISFFRMNQSIESMK